MTQAAKAKADDMARAVRIETHWTNADHLEPVFVDNLHLQRVQDLYYLTFGQIRVPLTERSAAPGSTVDGEIRPMVRLIVPREALEKVVGLLSHNLQPVAKK